MYFTQVLLSLFLFTNIQAANIHGVWNDKFKPYNEKRKEYKKKEEERMRKSRDTFSAVNSKYYKKKKELEENEKNEIKQMKQELYQNVTMPKFTGNNTEQYKKDSQKMANDLFSLRLEEGQRKTKIKHKYARLHIDNEKQKRKDSYKIMYLNNKEWDNLYDSYGMKEYPMPNPEIETVKKGKHESRERFQKSKIRIYKKAIIGKRNAVYQPFYQKVNIKRVIASDNVRFKYKYKLRDAYEENYEKGRTLSLDFLKVHQEALSKGKIEENQEYQQKKKEYTEKIVALDRKKQGFYNEFQDLERAEIELVENKIKETLEKRKKDLQDQFLATTPAYVQEALNKIKK